VHKFVKIGRQLSQNWVMVSVTFFVIIRGSCTTDIKCNYVSLMRVDTLNYVNLAGELYYTPQGVDEPYSHVKSRITKDSRIRNTS
jgi:hypothetical protein